MSSGNRRRKAKKKEKEQRREAWEKSRGKKQTTSPESRPPHPNVEPFVKDHTLLYHGTSGTRAKAMNAEGIVPRQGGTCNWPDRPGRPDCVYLSSVWALTYALHTVGRLGVSRGSEEGAILEVGKLDTSLLLPDEDFLFECLTMYYPENVSAEQEDRLFDTVLPEIRGELAKYAGRDWLDTLKLRYDGKVHEWANQFADKYGWQASLAGLGTCAYIGTISTSHIERTAYFPVNHPAFAHLRSLKPMTHDHLRYKAGLEAVNRWIFQDGPGPEHTDFKNRAGFRVTYES